MFFLTDIYVQCVETEHFVHRSCTGLCRRWKECKVVLLPADVIPPRPVCSCPDGFEGNPYDTCVKVTKERWWLIVPENNWGTIFFSLRVLPEWGWSSGASESTFEFSVRSTWFWLGELLFMYQSNWKKEKYEFWATHFVFSPKVQKSIWPCLNFGGGQELFPVSSYIDGVDDLRYGHC